MCNQFYFQIISCYFKIVIYLLEILYTAFDLDTMFICRKGICFMSIVCIKFGTLEIWPVEFIILTDFIYMCTIYKNKTLNSITKD